jgi:hypothetical protein
MTVQSFAPTSVPAVVTVPDSLPEEMAAIIHWANTAESARRLVEAIVDTPFMPAAFWPKHDQRDREDAAHAREVAISSGTAAILHGAPLGLDPMQALGNIHVIKGKPGLPAELMVALVRSHGHEVAVEDLTDTRCRVWGRRAGQEDIHRASFDISRAQKAGYVAQNSKYKTDPQSMLYARAMSILCRQMAPEALRGLSTVEELGDEADSGKPASGSRTVSPPAVSRKRPAKQLPPAPDPAPAPASTTTGDDLLGYDQPQPEQAASIAPAKWTAINATLNGLGVTGPGQQAARLAVVSYLVGREITRGGDLTADEGTAVLDTLTADGAVIAWDVLGPDSGFDLPGPRPDLDGPRPDQVETGQSLPDDPDAVDTQSTEDDPTLAPEWGKTS